MSIVKSAYQAAVRKIQKSILTDTLPTKEVNIEKEFERSLRTLGPYVTLDYTHRLDIRELKNKIIDYKTDLSLKRPFNIIMIAEPGSGKSFFIKCLANSMRNIGVGSVHYNMATFQTVDDLVQPLDEVRNLKVVDQLPILFLDEFDSPNVTYSNLLPLLWDGEIHLNHRDIRVGKVVIILAGSNPSIKATMEQIKTMKNKIDVDENDLKQVDLLSRINGGVFNIPSIDLEIESETRDRRVDKVFITLTLLNQRFGRQFQLVPWALLHFVARMSFRYGIRSITQLIDSISLNDKNEDILEITNNLLPLSTESELKKSNIVDHLISDKGSKYIVDYWKRISSCKTLVRVYTKIKEEEEEI